MSRLLLDTNILLDAIFDGRPYAADAQDVIARCNGRGDFGMVSGLSLKDVYYIATRVHGAAWARMAVRHLMGLLVIAPDDAEVFDLALNSSEPDFEDGIIRACAELNDADFIITRDADAFANSSVRSVTAGEYLRIAAANEGMASD